MRLVSPPPSALHWRLTVTAEIADGFVGLNFCDIAEVNLLLFAFV
jgi:hypothetical protein